MADFDLFDLVGIAFDPPEKNAKQVDKKIKEKITELGNELGRATQAASRKTIQGQLDYLNDIQNTILSPDRTKIINPVFRDLADKKTVDQISKLTSVAEILAINNERSITEMAIKTYRKEMKLSEEHVKEVFTKAGFEIVSIDPLKHYPKFPPNSDRVYNELAVLRQTKDLDPNTADTSIAVDLYSFAAYIKNDPTNIEMYKAMDTNELLAIFSDASMRFSTRNDDLGKYCGSISSAAKAYVFNSEENREAYNKFLLYKSLDLQKLFSVIRTLPDDQRLNPKTAEVCIRKISQYFSEYEVALAIYNKEAGVIYTPATLKYTIKCKYCDSVSFFGSEKDAIKNNSCQNCGKELFKQCDKCKKIIPIIQDSCPYCGYIFASSALFSNYYLKAQAELRNCNFDNARQFLFKAQSVAPAEKERLDQLSKQINDEEIRYKKPINRLNQLINEKKYCSARMEMGGFIKEFPRLNIKVFEQRINEEIERADKLFASVNNSNPSKKADTCLAILDFCIDYQPAILYLKATAPTPCSKITVSPDSIKDIISISWTHSTEQGVSYRLVRKTGMDCASSENDGEILVKDSSKTSFVDTNVRAGILYTYTVFTKRQEVYSTPTYKSGILYSDVKNCRVSQRESNVLLTWDAPNNSQGITIQRTCDGKVITLTDSAHGSYDDLTTQYGHTYTYKVIANYAGNRKSSGITTTITPLPKVDSFSINAEKVKDNEYKISWSICQGGIAIRALVNGRMIVEAKSEDKAVLLKLPEDTFCTIEICAYSSGQWIHSNNSIEVNTYTACGIDKTRTQIDESIISDVDGTKYRIDMKIYLSGKILPNVSSFYYTVRTSKDRIKWASLDDIGKIEDLNKLPLGIFQKNGYLPYQAFVQYETDFYVTVFTCYTVEGKEILSDPKTLKINRPLNANLFWLVTNKMFDVPKLSIELIGNRPLEYLPELYLCICDENHFLSSKDDKNGHIILKVPACDLGGNLTEYRNVYPIETSMSIKTLKKCKFFLFCKQDTTSKDKIQQRWKQGFLGKI